MDHCRYLINRLNTHHSCSFFIENFFYFLDFKKMKEQELIQEYGRPYNTKLSGVFPALRPQSEPIRQEKVPTRTLRCCAEGATAERTWRSLAALNSILPRRWRGNGLRLTGRKPNGDAFSVASTRDRSYCTSRNRNAFAFRVEAVVSLLHLRTRNPSLTFF